MHFRLKKLTWPFLLAGAANAVTAAAAAIPPMDSDTQAWWRATGDLSGDAMEGRDTGSPGHARAVAYVEKHFKSAGLKPAGTGGTFLQAVPLHEVRVEKTGTTITLLRPNGTLTELNFLHDITVRPTAELPLTFEAPMSFRGYCAAADMDATVKGKIAVCFGSRRYGLPTGTERLDAAVAAGAVGLINVDDRGFTIEPPHWPEAYARAVTPRGTQPPSAAAMPVLRLNADAFASLIKESGQSADDILTEGAASRPLPHFDLPARLRATFVLATSDYSSDNVLALLPGTDRTLDSEVIVISAHLDGYGIGEPVAGDAIYNGTFDDAAYVATLMRLAEHQKGHGFRRPVLFAVLTGEEKGLLGSRWFTQHPTIPAAKLAADINLDGVRPLFPLKILTALSLSESTLGQAARNVGNEMGIEIRADREPERNMRERTDHWPFLQARIPAICFLFGFDPGTDSERTYREWYRSRYHKPQDDLAQPFDGNAARDFNQFFYRLLGAVADGAARPSLSK